MERELRDEGANFGRSQGQDCYCALAVVKVRGDGFVRTEQGSPPPSKGLYFFNKS